MQGIDVNKKTLSFFQNNDTCNTCTQPIDKVFKQQKISSEANKISELEAGLTNLSKEIIKTQDKITEYNKIADRLNDLNISVAKVHTSISEINRHSNRLDSEIVKLQSDKENTDKVAYELDQLKEELGNLNKDQDVDHS